MNYDKFRAETAQKVLVALVAKAPYVETGSDDDHFEKMARGAMAYTDALIRELGRNKRY